MPDGREVGCEGVPARWITVWTRARGGGRMGRMGSGLPGTAASKTYPLNADGCCGSRESHLQYVRASRR